MSDTWTYAKLRWMVDRMSDHVEDWQGIPVPLEDMPVTLHDRHPLRDAFRGIDGVEVNIVAGGPTLGDDEDEKLVNYWVSRSRQCEVYVFQRLPSRRAFVLTGPLPPDGSMDRLTYWFTTIGASDAWDEEAEGRAREKLRGMLTDRQWRHYDLTGTFLETSPRSAVTYMFRRSRPTIALTPRWQQRPGREAPDRMRCLAVLCLHPVGYYAKTWGGCMVPSDDVVAHLLLMRGDEAYFWRVANQHEPRTPEAGL